MKKKLVSVLLCGAMAASLLAGCGNNNAAATDAAADAAVDAAADAAVEEAAVDAMVEEAEEIVEEEMAEEDAAEEGAEEVEAVTDTTGPEDGTPLELWTFVEGQSRPITDWT